jgi:hypothetical protein
MSENFYVNLSYSGSVVLKEKISSDIAKIEEDIGPIL